MRKIYITSISIIATVLIFQNCGSISSANQKGEEFYELIKEKKFENIILLLDEMALQSSSKEEWLHGLEDLFAERGQIEAYSNTGFNTSIQNDENIVKLDYSVTYANGVFKEQLEFIKRENGYKIVTYKFNMK